MSKTTRFDGTGWLTPSEKRNGKPTVHSAIQRMQDACAGITDPIEAMKIIAKTPGVLFPLHRMIVMVPGDTDPPHGYECGPLFLRAGTCVSVPKTRKPRRRTSKKKKA